MYPLLYPLKSVRFNYTESNMRILLFYSFIVPTGFPFKERVPYCHFRSSSYIIAENDFANIKNFLVSTAYIQVIGAVFTEKFRNKGNHCCGLPCLQ